MAEDLHALSHDAALLGTQDRAIKAARATFDLTQQSCAAGQASFLQMREA